MPRVRAFVVAAILAVAGCSSGDGDDPDLRTAGVFRAAFGWVIETRSPMATADDEEPVLYIVSGDAISIPTNVQVAVVDQMRDEATLRFTDSRDDALDTDTPGEPVKENGLLVTVGPVADEGSPIDMEIKVYRDETTGASFLLELAGSGDSWRVISSSEVPAS